jgi:ribosomal protein S18 acetylase RimI-like enzyme
MHLRRSKERDRHHIMAIARKFSDSINLADKKERLADAIGTDKVIVACHDDDKTMGFIYAYLKGAGHHLYKPGRSEVLISALCVDSTHHRKGAGKALLNELVKSNGHHKITCAVDATNKAGMSLFQKCGFKINGKICSFMREQPLEVTATLDKALLKHLRPFEITSAEIDPDKESFDIPEEAYEVPAGAMKLLAEAFLMDKKLDSTAKGKDSVK